MFGVSKDDLLGYNTVQSGSHLSTFRRKILPRTSGYKRLSYPEYWRRIFVRNTGAYTAHYTA